MPRTPQGEQGGWRSPWVCYYYRQLASRLSSALGILKRGFCSLIKELYELKYLLFYESRVIFSVSGGCLMTYNERTALVLSEAVSMALGNGLL